MSSQSTSSVCVSYRRQTVRFRPLALRERRRRLEYGRPPETSRRAVAYIRVSTEEQARHGFSLEAQADRVAAYCTMAGLELVAVFREEGVSASRSLASRPQGQKLLLLVESGQVHHVVSLKLDRLFRDACDCLNQTKCWDQQGVAFHIVDMGGQALNTSSAMGRLFLTMTAAFAELERNLISERTAMAMAEKARQGARLGGVPLGWRKVAGPDGKVTAVAVDPAGQELLARLRALREAGLTWVQMAETLTAEKIPTPRGSTIWNRGTVFKMLERAARGCPADPCGNAAAVSAGQTATGVSRQG